MLGDIFKNVATNFLKGKSNFTLNKPKRADMKYRPEEDEGAGGLAGIMSSLIGGDEIGREITPRPLEPVPSRGLNSIMPGEKGVRQDELSILRDEIERRENKDFRKGGADYDKDHDWKDALRAGGLGILKGLANADTNQSLGAMLGQGLGGGIAGGVGGAIDRNADEKMGNEIKLGQLYKQYEPAFNRRQAEEKAESDKRYRDAQIADMEARPGIRQAEVDLKEAEIKRKQAKDKAEVDIKTKTLDWKDADRKRYYELEEQKQQAKQVNDDRAYDLAVRKQIEIERSNQVKESQGERKIATQEAKAQASIRKMQQGGSSGGSKGGGRTAKPKSMSGAQFNQWMKVAQDIDNRFNSGEIDEATYNNLINAMTQRMSQ